jgi:hypothetical protein
MAGHKHACVRISAPWSKESLTPTLSLPSYPLIAFLFRACPGN